MRQLRKQALHISIAFIAALFVSSCSSTKYLGEEEYLLNKYKIEDQESDVSAEDYKNYIKQKPNKRIAGYRFWMHLYNMANEEKNKGIHRWLRKVGEEPVVFSEDLTYNTTQQLQLFLRNKGYFNAHVEDSVIFRKSKANVIYSVDPGKAYTIANIDFFFEDASLSRLLLSDSIPSLIQAGDRLDVELLQMERQRLETLLKNNGYYNFSKEFVYYEIDSTLGDYQVSLIQGIRNFPVQDARGRVVDTRHPVYSVRNVYMKTLGGAVVGSPGQETYVDTVQMGDVFVLEHPDVHIKSGLVTQKNSIIPGKLYNKSKVQRTYRNLTALSAFRLVDIAFLEVEGSPKELDCEIQLLPAVKHAFTGGIEGTTSGGNIGAAGNLNYQHRNLLGGSEKFDFTLSGAIESLSDNPESDGYYTGTMKELGVELSLDVPQFLLPISMDRFIRKYNPLTSFDLSYNYQSRPDYTRTTFSGRVQYRWKGNKHLTHALYPVEISLINTPYLSIPFKEWLSQTYLNYSYQSHFINDIRYNAVFSNQRVNKEVDFNYLRFGVETAGNALYGLSHLLGYQKRGENLEILGEDFAQYSRAELDFRHYDYRDDGVTLAYRAYVGAAIPYLNSPAIPFEKQFFAGGANSLRAWRVKNLGPGSYVGDSNSQYPNQTGDLKIEANIEYRFQLFWKLEGAFFLDAGNIWSLSKEDTREGALFVSDRFYKEFAVASGFGARFDFSIILVRLDIGMPLVDPSYPEGERWVPAHGTYEFDDFGFNIAIGYPF